MNKEYNKNIIDLTFWFKSWLEQCTLDPYIISKDDWRKGVDALPQYYKDLTKYAGLTWLFEKNYELSYTQICVSFFEAGQLIGQIRIGD